LGRKGKERGKEGSAGSDHADLYVHELGQGAYLYRFTGREVALEIFAVDLVHLAKLVHIGEEDGGLDHVAEGHAGFLENIFQVLHHLVGLFLDVAVLQVAGGGINADLSGDEEQAGCFHPLVIRSDRCGSVLRVDDLFFHAAVYKGANIGFPFKSFLCKNLPMHLLLLASEDLKTELLSTPLPEGTRITHLTGVEGLSGEYDAVVDLSYSPAHAERLQAFLPRPVLVSSLEQTLEELPQGFVRFNGWPTFLNHAIEAAAPEGLQEAAAAVFTALGREVAWTPDVPGFLSARVVCSIINEAYLALGEGVSTKEAIDQAMRLGTNYPFGPFEWAGRIGLEQVRQLLTTLAAGEARFQPAPLLKAEGN
jgi:3-hydroxybutyryl-CoA dehydrogenase